MSTKPKDPREVERIRKMIADMDAKIKRMDALIAMERIMRPPKK